MSLAKYTTDQLLEEIARRRNASRERKPITHWCENCANFKCWTGKSDPPDDFNACSKGHKMSFRVPEGYNDEMGYYRRVCADRAQVSENDG